MWNRACVSAPDASARSIYRVRRGYFVRALGRAALVAAVLVLLTTVSLALSFPGAVTALLVVLTTVALVAVTVIVVSVLLPPTLLQLDQIGFRASKRYSAGRRQGPWAEVQAAASQEGPDGWVLMIQHHDGEHTAVPLSIVDGTAVEIERDVRNRLNDAHGYRPLT